MTWQHHPGSLWDSCQPHFNLSVLRPVLYNHKIEDSSFLSVTRFQPLSFLVLVFSLFNNHSITPGRCYLCLCLCSSPSSLGAVRALTLVCHLSFDEGRWCTFFPHLDKEQFNKIWVLFLVRGQWLISEVALYWPLSLTCFLFTACWHTNVKLRAKYLMTFPWFHSQIFTHKYRYACSRLTECYLISTVHRWNWICRHRC